MLVLDTTWGRAGIEAMSRGVANLLGYAKARAPIPLRPRSPRPSSAQQLRDPALPVIIFFASLISILYYLGIMQRIVRWVGGAIGW